MAVTPITLEPSERNGLQNFMTAEEKLRHERREKRRLRRKGSPNQYHHIPCSAALDFARTTTPEPLIPEKVHKLARPIMEHYTGKSPCNVPQYQSLTPKPSMSEACSGSVIEASKRSGDRILRRKIAQRSLELSRYAQLSSLSTHNPPFGAKGRTAPKYPHRPSSHRLPMATSPSVNDRPDWTEQDECPEPQSSSILSRVGPLFRRSESIWSVQHGLSKHVEVALCDNDSIVNMRQGNKFRYPWNCACFL